MARPRMNLDEDQIKELATIQCTYAEIAAVMKCSIDVIQDRYAHIVKEGREAGKTSLRRAQYKKAMDGNPALLIWLGKHYLEQKDEIKVSSTEPEVRTLLSQWEKLQEDERKMVKRANWIINKKDKDQPKS